MQPLDRYLNNLSKLLPVAQREDILRELSEDVRSEMEDKQAGLGRTLTEEEQYEILKRRGNPLQVAAGYTSNKGTFAFGPQWIGPVLFPFYVRVLTFNLGLTFLILGGIFAALSLSGQPISFSYIVSNALLQLFIQLTAVTAVFSLVEKHLSRHPDHWNRQAVNIEVEKEVERILRDIPKKIREVSRFESLSILVASTVGLMWMQALWTHPFFVFGPAASLIQFGPIWHRIYMPTVAIILASMLRAAINLARPDWVLFRNVAALVFEAASLAIIYVLMFSGSWVVPVPTANSASAPHIAQVVNQWMPYGFWAAAVISIFQIIKNLITLYKNWRWGSSASSNQ
ncbi:MAG TPA: hypothetical protein VN025_14695 [Candidatus Dormibacteraeota bacterium]|jgi:hypothetical protein|nr:hypothetical protein [Candidatus Dormibacteraeota bacterium]